MGTPLYISVVLPLALSTPYTYAVPEELKGQMVRGLQVLVPLGERLQAGIVWQVGVNGLDSRTVRKVQAILDPTPVVLEGQLQLWEWMAEYYCCTLGDMVRATLPAGLRFDRDAYVCACYPELPPLPSMPFLAKEMLGRVQLAKELKLELLLPVKGDRDYMKALKHLMDLGLVALEERIRRKSTPRAKIYYQVPRRCLERGGLKEVVQNIKHKGQHRAFAYAFSRIVEMGGATMASISRGELLTQGQATPGILSALEKKGLLIRTSFDSAFYTTDNEEIGLLTKLSAPQQQALEQLQASMRTHGVTLLHGVTGSGKTEIYIHLIAKTLAQGKQVLYLLPEIALTEQIIGRLRAVFGSRVGVYHSRLSDSERTSLYNALRGKGVQGSLSPEPHDTRYTAPENSSSPRGPDIILCARSGVLLPFSRLGLVIVDEEHEMSFKQSSPAPRYHGRNAAIVLGRLLGVPVLLGTATPAVESYRNALEGKYGLVELTGRYGLSMLPEVELVDMAEARAKNLVRGHFSVVLLDAVEQALRDNYQVILFQNRRGYAPYCQCGDCGWVATCPNCDVSLTYHRIGNALHCHYCGHVAPLPLECPECHQHSLYLQGLGTQRVEEELTQLIPTASVGRLDLDTTKGAEGAQRVIGQFSDGEINVLIGTQMVAKGLDFSRVRLVGILNADALICMPDFRATERAFQLMAQVGGRAGRRETLGRVLIQTQRPEQPIFTWVAQHSYTAFYQNTIAEREALGYPPFGHLVAIMLRHGKQERVDAAAAYLAGYLRQQLGDMVLGPQAPLLARVCREFQMQILLKVPLPKSLAAVRGILLRAITSTRAQKGCSTVKITVDVDPV